MVGSLLCLQILDLGGNKYEKQLIWTLAQGANCTDPSPSVRILWFVVQWKGIDRKQSTRWQHLSRLKASAFFSLQKKLVVIKHSNLNLGLVLPSGGWQSLIPSPDLNSTPFDFYQVNFLETSGLHYKHIEIVTDASRVIGKSCSKFWHQLRS
jgi:hypothetical protein